MKTLTGRHSHVTRCLDDGGMPLSRSDMDSSTAGHVVFDLCIDGGLVHTNLSAKQQKTVSACMTNKYQRIQQYLFQKS